MNTIQDLYQQAQLAEAAYANFWSSGTNSVITDAELVKKALQDKTNSMSFSTAQAAAFALEWSVVSQQPDTENGFSATLFKNNNKVNSYSLAIRGSLQTVDFYQDALLISKDGIAVSQVVDMYNYWQRLNHSGVYTVAKLTSQTVETAFLESCFVGSPVITAALLNLSIGIDIPTGFDAARAFFVAAGYVVEGVKVYKVESDTSTNLYTDPADPRRLGENIVGLSSVDVDGHSLGGHLAMAFSRLFPDATKSATAVNGLGFKIGYSNVDNLYAALGSLPSSPMGVGTAFDASKIQNVYGINGPEFASMNNSVLQQPTPAWDGIYIEDGSLFSAQIGGHSAIQMTDSLAVYNLFSQLDPQLNTASSDNINKISGILKACSNVADNSLESAISMLGKLVNFMGSPAPQYTGNEFNVNRDLLYKAIEQINGANGDMKWFDLSFTSLHDLTTLGIAEIVSVALDTQNLSSLAYRYALLNLTPFAVVGNNMLFDAHNDNHQLDLYQPQPVYSTVPATGTLSQEWIADRAYMLAWKLRINSEDAQAAEFNPYLAGYDVPALYFSDRSITHGAEIYLGGVNRSQVVFGSDDLLKGDAIDGGASVDHLYGGAGDDVINGGGSSDYLEGGAGHDTLRGDGGISWYGARGDDILDGGAGNDILIGGGGSDILLGGDGNDILIGGGDANLVIPPSGFVPLIHPYDSLNTLGVANTLVGGLGFDSYYATSGDVIRDADKKGRVIFNGQQLGGGASYRENVWMGCNKQVYRMNGTTLFVWTNWTGVISIENFTNGDLGINLGAYTPLPPAPPPKMPTYNTSNGLAGYCWTRWEYDKRTGWHLAHPLYWDSYWHPYDPLVLDLNGNGQIDTVSSTNSTSYFDFNGDGIAEKSGWVAAGDGILALDANNNGAVDNLSELFGSATQDGFVELAGLDN